MLKLSLYGFEVYEIKGQYFCFYLEQLISHNSILTIDKAIDHISRWIDCLADDYNGPSVHEFRSKYYSVFEVTK